MSLLLSTGALVLAAAPAMAAAPMGFAGNASLGYGSTSCDGCDSVDNWSVNGSGAFGIGGGGNLGAQIDGSFTGISGDGSDLNVWGIGGSLFYAPGMWRGGANVNFNTADEGGVDFDLTSYGVFGEFFLSDFFTIGAKGGGLSATLGAFGYSDSESGYYVGGGLTGYVMPNLAISGAIDHISVSDIDTDATTYGIGAEFLVSDMVPIAIFGGYAHTQSESGGFDFDSDTWRIGVRIYTNGNGVTLVERHRNGAVGGIRSLEGMSLLF
jgi:hypothetical protein